MIIHSSVVLNKLPEGDTEAFNARSKLDAENMPRTTEESNQNKQSSCTAIFILLHGNTLHGILALNTAMLLKANAKNPTRLFLSKLSDSVAVSSGQNAKLKHVFII